MTLIATALGWISLPRRPVEVLIAASVALSAIHAIRPLAAHGEEIIAVGFGLVHGMAFAGILTDLGLEGSTSLLALFAFNVGIELSQIVATVLVFPSLYIMSRTRSYPRVRVVGASVALVAAIGWAIDRLGLLVNPFELLEDAAIGHPWHIVVIFALAAILMWLVDGRWSRNEEQIPTTRPAGKPRRQ